MRTYMRMAVVRSLGLHSWYVAFSDENLTRSRNWAAGASKARGQKISKDVIFVILSNRYKPDWACHSP